MITKLDAFLRDEKLIERNVLGELRSEVSLATPKMAPTGRQCMREYDSLLKRISKPVQCSSQHLAILETALISYLWI